MKHTNAAAELVHMLFHALNSRDLSCLEQHLAQDAVFDFPGPGLIRGRTKIIAFFKFLFRKYRRLTFTLSHIITQGEHACAVWTNEGEDRTGQAYCNRGITLLQCEADKITFLSDYFKDTSFNAATKIEQP